MNRAEQASDDLSAPPTISNIVEQFENCADFIRRDYAAGGISVFYLVSVVGQEPLFRDIVHPFGTSSEEDLPAILDYAPYRLADDTKKCIEGILAGHAAIFREDKAWLVDLGEPQGRSVEQSETETVIAGPHDGFVESLYQNVSVMRARVRSPRLKTVMLSVGEISNTQVMLMYVDGIVNQDNVDTLTNRIRSIEIDAVGEGNMLVQLIDENPNSVFPQFITTERPDAAVSKLMGGKIVGIVDGSPSVFVCPTSFSDFFSSPDDYYQRWMLGSALRLLRIIGFAITIGFTAFYVSVTTFHYEMIPHTMLLNLTESRSKVPFPPLYEALLMETTIELLREAGARLPTKIGQTIGIVGGIVIGQAAVQAGFTSNILIIAVATSAIASFVIPSYIMSASLRLIRFGLILLAGLLGNLGIFFGITLIIIHLAGITNLGASYLTPLAPMSFRDMLDTIVRGPFWALTRRPTISRSPNRVRVKRRI
ncbi:spore germination protein [Cohnella fermenti]|uniref:Spore germination protein n=1 Tax=Cohnella fermenti TaxID=2565925 RepID=A0A4S4BI84_9BACL|nr:spore germination protein [Cohnella fermenti]THF73291.1 spore germination protein [Cohnella fermenti]